MIRNNSNKVNVKALIDALAGTVASLLALWILYPMDVWLTNVQATTAIVAVTSLSSKSKDDSVIPDDDGLAIVETNEGNKIDNSSSSSSSTTNSSSGIATTEKVDIVGSVNKDHTSRQYLTTATALPPPTPHHDQLYQRQSSSTSSGTSSKSSNTSSLLDLLPISTKDMYAGLIHKSIHTASSSFCYFFLYSRIFTTYKTIQLKKKQSQLQSQRKRTNKNFINNMNSTNNDTCTGGDAIIIVSTAMQLLLTAIAAMVNTFLTLPLDGISARQQKQISSTTVEVTGSKFTTYKQNQHEHEQQQQDSTKPLVTRSTTISTTKTEAETRKNTSYSTNNTRDSTNILNITKKNEKSNEKTMDTITIFSNILSLWKGLTPSLILCINPAIHYTTFESIKSYYIIQQQQRQRQRHQVSNRHIPHNKNAINTTNNPIQKKTTTTNELSMFEAFIIGLVAKFVATIATYPLIKAKVMLMVSSSSAGSSRTDTATRCCNCASSTGSSTTCTDDPSQCTDQHDTSCSWWRNCHHPNDCSTCCCSNRTTRTTTETKITTNKRKFASTIVLPTFVTILIDEYKKGGIISGLYRGCCIQLLHTMLKSALLMMFRERILQGTIRTLQLTTATSTTKQCQQREQTKQQPKRPRHRLNN